MINLDEDALICDLAETYQIYDYRSLPVRLVATLSAGLRDDSRIKLKAAGESVGIDTTILAAIADNLSLLRLGFSKDARRSKPFLFTDALQGETTKSKVKGFRTAAEFEAALKRIRGE
jgi:hypothetical protein